MTQGLVTIQKDGKVVVKIVAGCNGKIAKTLASAIQDLGRVPKLREAYDLAQKAGFGSKECLVVVGARSFFHQCDEPLSQLFRETFKQPRFNPRWDLGTADYVRVVRF